MCSYHYAVIDQIVQVKMGLSPPHTHPPPPHPPHPSHPPHHDDSHVFLAKRKLGAEKAKWMEE